MSLGIPIVCNDGIGDTTEILNKYKAGLTVAIFSVTEYDSVIHRLLTTEFDTKLIQAGAHQEYNLQDGIVAYKKTYDKLLSN
jgi:hypothetical protein